MMGNIWVSWQKKGHQLNLFNEWSIWCSREESVLACLPLEYTQVEFDRCRSISQFDVNFLTKLIWLMWWLHPYMIVWLICAILVMASPTYDFVTRTTENRNLMYFKSHKSWCLVYLWLKVMTCIFVTQFRRDAELAAGLGVAVGLIGIEMVR